MNHATSITGAERLEAAIRRLEGAIANPVSASSDADLQRRHAVLTAQTQAALDGIDRLLADAEAR